MLTNRKCPFNGKDTLPFNAKKTYECRDNECRFQINGVCAVIGSFIEARFTSARLSQMAKTMGISLQVE